MDPDGEKEPFDEPPSSPIGGSTSDDDAFRPVIHSAHLDPPTAIGAAPVIEDHVSATPMPSSAPSIQSNAMVHEQQSSLVEQDTSTAADETKPSVLNIVNSPIQDSAIVARYTQQQVDLPANSNGRVQPLPVATEQISANTTDNSTIATPPPTSPTTSKSELVNEEGEINYTDEDVQRDAANIAVMAIVNIALLFFAGLFIFAVTASILFMGKFGFVTFVIVLILVGIVVGTVIWVVQTVTNDDELKPVSNKMKRWHAIAKAVVVNEIRNFQLDMQDHMLLTNGEEDYDDYEGMGDAAATGSAESMPPPTGTSTGRDTRSSTGTSEKPRSMVFGLVVKPFLKGKKKMKKFGRKKKKNKKAAANIEDTNKYVPPAATTDMV